MAIKFEFPRPSEDIFRLLTDRHFLVARSSELGELESSCRVGQQDDRIIVNMKRTIPLKINGFLARYAEPQQTMVIEEVWRDVSTGWEGTCSMELENYPLVLSTAFSLIDSGSGSRYEADYCCDINAPLIPGKVKRMIVSHTEKSVVRDLEFVQASLRSMQV